MNTASTGDLGANLRQYIRLRFFRKHFYRLFHIVVAAIGGFQVEDAVAWIARMAVSPETIGDIDQEQGQIRRMRHSCGSDLPEVFQAPGLCGISKVTLDWEPQSVIVHEEGTAEQHDMGPGLGMEVGLGDDDHSPELRKLLVEPWHLVQAGLEVPLDGRLLERVHREVVIIHLGASLAPGTSPRIGTRRGELQRRIVPQLGNEV